MRIIRKYHKFIFIVVLPVIAWLFVNSTLNRHNHIVQGYVISHAHPYQKDADSGSPFQSHRHTEDELILFDRISNFLIVLAGVLFIAIFLQCIREFRSFQTISIPFTFSLPFKPDRGPPSFH